MKNTRKYNDNEFCIGWRSSLMNWNDILEIRILGTDNKKTLKALDSIMDDLFTICNELNGDVLNISKINIAICKAQEKLDKLIKRTPASVIGDRIDFRALYDQLDILKTNLFN